MTATTKNAPAAIDPRVYPALRDALRGYLNEDWTTEYADSEDAARAFRRDAADDEARAVAAEAKKLRAAIAGMEVRDLRKLLGAGFGTGWRPSTAVEADKVLRLFAGE
ncbi:MAG: contact-dependent growth inhibition system immunity protein [Thermoanaerobaculia bacterium]